MQMLQILVWAIGMSIGACFGVGLWAAVRARAPVIATITSVGLILDLVIVVGLLEACRL